MKEAKPEILSSDVPFKGRKLEIQSQAISFGGRKSVVETVTHPGAVAILAFTPQGKVLLERQYRHSVGRYIYELPAGTLEPGEDPKECASRELEEETGYTADSLKEVGAMYTAPGYSSEVLHLFVARAGKHGGQRLEGDERISVSAHSLSEARRLVMGDGPFDGKSMVLLQLAASDKALLDSR
ncbi:MAG TPA: NUDIX hydrolase [Conexivisphaerales archaeon]|nr:NUDIX hydrolase [Conexivisphaerales archaeon]